MIVVDTSAVVAAFCDSRPPPGLIERLSEPLRLHAPHLIDIEFVHALRKLTLLDQISAGRADRALTSFASLRIARYPHTGLRARMWEMRDSVPAYDAAFIALSEALQLPLVTCDGRLSRAHGHSATIELFGP